ncbi:helix-turn-helix domain-containing protein [Blautia pseudococcoides]|nr:helix-turn-helix transcriptional regulator [Blautia pseudococcoides]MCR2019082.1 helix-turn-helix domain-containing protein [Blautia pseudococcoides]QQQ93872.1 helix-turn-helix transcriptional regulator [Blautia pseudococcoides]
MYDYDLCLIGKRIKELRNSRDMVQEVLAERIGVSWSTISRLERGDSMVSIDKLLAIAEALGTGIDSILYDFISNDESSDDLTTRQLKYILQLLNQKQKEYFLKNMQLFVSLFTEDTDK